MEISSWRRVYMKKLKHIRKSVFRHEFTEKQMREYFTKNDTPKEVVKWTSILLGFFCVALIFFFPAYLLIWLCAGTVFCFVAFTMLLILRFGVHPPTDEEYDSWVK